MTSPLAEELITSVVNNIIQPLINAPPGPPTENYTFQDGINYEFQDGTNYDFN